MSMLFYRANAMASCTLRYSVPARTSSLRRGELARRAGGTSAAIYCRKIGGAFGATEAMEGCCPHARGPQSRMAAAGKIGAKARCHLILPILRRPIDLEGGQFCPQPAFSRLWPPKRRLRPRLAALQFLRESESREKTKWHCASAGF